MSGNDSATSGGNWYKTCLFSCLGCAGLAAVLVGAISAVFFWGTRSMGPHAEEFLDALEREDYRQAWSLVGPEWREATTFEDFRLEQVRRREKLGQRTSLETAGLSFVTRSRGALVRVSYQAEFERGSAELEVTLKKSSGRWRVIGLDYDTGTPSAPPDEQDVRV